MSNESATGPDAWSKVAREYHRNIVPGFQPAAESLCRFAGIKSGDKVLDIGCGPGTASMAAAALGAEVTGVDSAPGMIALARELAGSKRNLTFLEGDALQLPVQSNEFDAVVSSFGVIFAPSATKGRVRDGPGAGLRRPPRHPRLATLRRHRPVLRPGRQATSRPSRRLTTL